MSTEAEPLDASAGSALATIARDAGGAMTLAMLSDADFESRLKSMKVGMERMRRIQAEMMTKDEDYGIIPGTKKHTLLKPGAEKICVAYGLVATFDDTLLEGDGEHQPDLRVKVVCTLHLKSADGPIVGQGLGAANSWERKHRYRSGQRTCPSCGVEGSISRSQFEDRDTRDKGWYCNAKRGGCGAKFVSTDRAITEQSAGQVENPDPYDVENTLLKMAAKRAQVDAVLRTTATSGLFTQDSEDLPLANSAPSVVPAERQSQRAAPAAPVTPLPPQPDVLGPNVGLVVAIMETSGGGMVKLSTGFVAFTRDAVLLSAAQRARDGKTRVDLATTPSPTDPKKYAPTLTGITTLENGQ